MGSAKLKPTIAEIVPLKPRRPLTPKQERFARIVAERGCAAEAYRGAFDVSADIKPETVHSEASRLMANPKVSARVRDIETEALAATQLTIGRLAAEGFALLEMAKADGDVRAATAVLATLGKLHERLAPHANRRNVGTAEGYESTGSWLEDILASASEQKARVTELVEKLGDSFGSTPAQN